MSDIGYEAPKEKRVYTPSVDGTVEIDRVTPTMTICTDNADAIVDLEYGKDLTKVIDAHCELIEEITVTASGVSFITRNAMPDGTPYNFKAVTVYQEKIPTTVKNLIIVQCFDGEDTFTSNNLCSYQANNEIATAGRFLTAHFGVIGGCWQSIGVATTFQGSPTSTQMWRYTVPYTGQTIKSIRLKGNTTAFEVGTVFRIYGVRA